MANSATVPPLNLNVTSPHGVLKVYEQFPDLPNPITALRSIMLPRCIVCGCPTIFTCSRCADGPSYCRPQHFIADWPRHRKHCTGAGERTWAEATHEAERLSELEGLQAGMSDGVRSTSEQTEETAYTVIGLLAHPEMDVPTFVEVRMVRTTTTSLAPALNEYFPGPVARTFIQFGEDMRFLSNHPFHIFFCPESFIANKHLNRAVASLTADIEPEPRKWPGLVLILKLAVHGCWDYVNFAEDDIRELARR